MSIFDCILVVMGVYLKFFLYFCYFCSFFMKNICGEVFFFLISPFSSFVKTTLDHCWFSNYFYSFLALFCSFVVKVSSLYERNLLKINMELSKMFNRPCEYLWVLLSFFFFFFSTVDNEFGFFFFWIRNYNVFIKPSLR